MSFSRRKILFGAAGVAPVIALPTADFWFQYKNDIHAELRSVIGEVPNVQLLRGSDIQKRVIDTREKAAALLANHTVIARPWSDTHTNIKIATYQIGQDLDKPTILFLHGTPGFWGDHVYYIDSLAEHANLIFIDRPGFGDSGKNQIVPLVEQSRMLRAMMDDLGVQRYHIVAHSWGGAVAAQMALDDAFKVTAMTLVAPALAPQYENLDIVQRVIINSGNFVSGLDPILFLMRRWLDMESYVTAARELEGANTQLVTLTGDLRHSPIATPTTIFQGDRDGLVDPRTPAAVKENKGFRNLKTFEIYGGTHQIYWTHFPVISQNIREQLRRLSYPRP